MNTREEHYVTFYSPGTFVSESTSKPIAEWNPRVAVGMAESVVERHGAKPYAFRFETRLVADPLPDGRGGHLNVESRVERSSGLYHLGGKVETLADVEARNDPSEEILLSNMRCNEIAAVVVNTNSYKHTTQFCAEDVIVDAAGEVIARGSDYVKGEHE